LGLVPSIRNGVDREFALGWRNRSLSEKTLTPEGGGRGGLRNE
jgi:hypothetical protein